MIHQFAPFAICKKLNTLGYTFQTFSVYDDLGFLQDQKEMTALELNFTPALLWQQCFEFFEAFYNIDAWVQPFVQEKSNGRMFLPDESYSYFIFKDGVFVKDGAGFLCSQEARLECINQIITLLC